MHVVGMATAIAFFYKHDLAFDSCGITHPLPFNSLNTHSYMIHRGKTLNPPPSLCMIFKSWMELRLYSEECLDDLNRLLLAAVISCVSCTTCWRLCVFHDHLAHVTYRPILRWTRRGCFGSHIGWEVNTAAVAAAASTSSLYLCALCLDLCRWKTSTTPWLFQSSCGCCQWR